MTNTMKVYSSSIENNNAIDSNYNIWQKKEIVPNLCPGFEDDSDSDSDFNSNPTTLYNTQYNHREMREKMITIKVCPLNKKDRK